MKDFLCHVIYHFDIRKWFQWPNRHVHGFPVVNLVPFDSSFFFSSNIRFPVCIPTQHTKIGRENRTPSAERKDSNPKKDVGKSSRSEFYQLVSNHVGVNHQHSQCRRFRLKSDCHHTSYLLNTSVSLSRYVDRDLEIQRERWKKGHSFWPSLSTMPFFLLLQLEHRTRKRKGLISLTCWTVRLLRISFFPLQQTKGKSEKKKNCPVDPSSARQTQRVNIVPLFIQWRLLSKQVNHQV